MPNDDINARIEAGRQQIEMAPDRDIDESAEPRRVPPVAIAAGVGAAIVGLGLIGWMLYRSRRRRTLMEQLQAALPGRIDDLRELGLGLRDRGMDVRDELRERLRKAR